MSAQRSECYRCLKPAVSCVCDTLPRVNNQTSVLILQHPRERFHALNTVRLARLALANIDVVIDPIFHDPRPNPKQLVKDRAGVLFPKSDATHIETLTEADIPRQLIVLDGTWHQAKMLYRANDWLMDLPHYQLIPTTPSNYRLRREPKENYTSTLEALLQALRFLEPQTQGFDELLQAFDRMIDTQIDAGKVKRPRYRKQRAISSRTPPLSDNLLITHAEFISTQIAGEAVIEPVYWAAHRVRSGEQFCAYIRPQQITLQTDHLKHMQLSPELINSGLSHEEFLKRWHAFIHAEDVLAPWTSTMANLLIQNSQWQGPSCALKTAYCNFSKGPSGEPHAILEANGLQPFATPFAGRTGTRMSYYISIAQYMQDADP